jgi:hypothetical protein
MKEFIPIKEFEIQYTSSPPHPLRKRRKGLYISDSNDEEIKEKINVKEIDGDEAGGEKADESINIKENVEKIIKEINEKIVRTRSNKKVKRARISLTYYGKMEDRRIEGLKYKTKPKITRRRRG